MTAKIFESKKIDQLKLHDFEMRLGFKLPDNYKKFLLTHNGGYPEPDCFTTLDNSEGSSIDRFLGLDVGEHSNLDSYWKTYKDRIPRGFFPIAHDPGGNLVILKIEEGGLENGVFFWDHESEADGFEPDLSNISKISHSLQGFLDSLHELPEE